jgi:AraC family transcriptional regulator
LTEEIAARERLGSFISARNVKLRMLFLIAGMKNEIEMSDYADRLDRVIVYLHDHLDETDLDLNKLAEIACMSPYHWHRIYQAIQGETLASTVKRLRLLRAAGYLAQTSMPISRIAKKSGYPNVQSFTRVFRSVYGMPPARYRKLGSHTEFTGPKGRATAATHEVAIRNAPVMGALVVEHLGSYMQINRAFDTLYSWLGSRKLLQTGMRSVGIFLDDPALVPEAKLRSMAAGIMDSISIRAEPPVKHAEIREGAYAVLRYKGPYANMKAAYQWLYGTWLPNSGRDAADAPALEEYLNSPRDTPPGDLLTDIWLPLRCD